MPRVVVEFWSGESAARKARATDAVTEAVAASAGRGGEAVPAAVEDLEPREWMAKAHGPAIVGARHAARGARPRPL